MPEHVSNIGERGARRRRRSGVFWIVVAAVAIAAFAAFDAPRWTRLALVLPFGLSAAGFLQSRAKT